MTREKGRAIEIVALLQESAEDLDSSIVGRLAEMRSKAVAHLTAQGDKIVYHGGAVYLLGSFFHHHRFAMSTALVFSSLALAFIIGQQFYGIDAVGQGDAFLLASDLPPEAYMDRGFAAWLADASVH